MSSSNPAFSREMFAGYDQVYGMPRSTATTVQGTIGKTALLLAILSATGLWSWYATASGQIPPAVLGIAAIGGFIVAMVGLASFNLLLDFDFIEQAARAEAPKYMEWYGAFGLMVTLVWLYLEILRLLRKLADQR